MEGLGSIHNKKRQSLGLKQSLAEAWKNHLIIWLHFSPPDTGLHTHTHLHSSKMNKGKKQGNESVLVTNSKKKLLQDVFQPKTGCSLSFSGM